AAVSLYPSAALLPGKGLGSAHDPGIKIFSVTIHLFDDTAAQALFTIIEHCFLSAGDRSNSLRITNKYGLCIHEPYAHIIIFLAIAKLCRALHLALRTLRRKPVHLVDDAAV